MPKEVTHQMASWQDERWREYDGGMDSYFTGLFWGTISGPEATELQRKMLQAIFRKRDDAEKRASKIAQDAIGQILKGGCESRIQFLCNFKAVFFLDIKRDAIFRSKHSLKHPNNPKCPFQPLEAGSAF